MNTTFHKLLRVFLILGALGVFALALWKVPEWQVAGYGDVIKPEKIPDYVNEFLKTLAQILGGLVLLYGLYLTWRRITATEKTVELTREGQVTERFTRAIEQLGSDRLEIRLGGIYALERIAWDSERDHWPIMEVLTAYVREHASWPPKTPEEQPTESIESQPTGEKEQQPEPKPPIDIQAILTVIGRRNPDFAQRKLKPLDLRGTDLRGTYLVGANLQKAFLSEANLQKAVLRGANLQRANFSKANLQQAFFVSANLQEAWLFGANLKEAWLFGANVQKTYLREANMQQADLRKADLRGAIGLTVEELAKVKTLFEAILDPELQKQIEEQYPHLLEKPE
ncbi:MAG: pentapeptide repeat-containing protein [Desulfobacteraceae bacterium]